MNTSPKLYDIPFFSAFTLARDGKKYIKVGALNGDYRYIRCRDDQGSTKILSTYSRIKNEPVE